MAINSALMQTDIKMSIKSTSLRIKELVCLYSEIKRLTIFFCKKKTINQICPKKFAVKMYFGCFNSKKEDRCLLLDLCKRQQIYPQSYATISVGR